MQQICRVFSALLIFLVFLASTGEAATKKKTKESKPSQPSMTFTLVRSDAASCEPSCPQWIAAEGKIVGSSASQFRQFLKKIGKARYPVIITSPGGDVESALAIGNMIRERKMDVAVGWTVYAGCAPSDKKCKLPKASKGVYRGAPMTSRSYCVSACPFILAAGQRRVAGSGSYVGVHQITTQPISQRVRYYETYRIVNGKKKILNRKIVSRKNIVGKTTTKIAKPFDRKLHAYLKKMGVNGSMLDLLQLAPPSAMHELTAADMKSIGLATDFLQSADLVASSLCGKTPPADNCVVNKNYVAAALPVVAIPKQPASLRPAEGKPMKVYVVRNNAAGCEPTCTEWIYASGVIEPESPGLFKEALEKVGGRHLPVIIQSDGGDADAAMDIGRMIRARKLDVVVGATLFKGCSSAFANCYVGSDARGRYQGVAVNVIDRCNSACSLVLAAGTKRLSQMNQMNREIAVQQLYAKASSPTREETEFYKRVSKYLDDMGVSRALIAYMDKAKPASLYYVPLIELKTSRLVTGRASTADITDNALCKQPKPAKNCVSR